MPLFPSQEWCDAYAKSLNNSAEFAAHGKDHASTAIWVITPEGNFTKTVRIYMVQDHGHMPDLHVITEGETRKADMTATASLGVWRKLIEGKLNPMPAIVRGQLKVEGMSMKAIRNAKTMQTMFEQLLLVPTEFPS